MSTDSHLRNMLANPLAYVSDEQWNAYRSKVVLTSLIFIGVGVILVLLDLVLYSRGVDMAAVPPGSTTRSTQAGNGLMVLYYAIAYLSMPYGIYRLITFKKYMARLAKRDLIATNPSLRQLDERARKASEQALTSKVKTTGAVVNRVFVVLLGLLVIATVTIVIGVVGWSG